MFSVDTPAESRALLSADELRLAAGLSATDTSQDGRLAELGLRAADAIGRHCCADDGEHAPTLLSELCSETIRLDQPRDTLVLARRFVTEITGLTENGVGLGAGSYELKKSAGLLLRVSGERTICWTGSKVIVQYRAGFEAPHNDLKHAAELLVRQMTATTARDPTVRRERVDGVGEFEYWVGSIDPKNGAPFTSDIMALLAPFRSPSI
jgi:hypothetical protein